MAKRDEAIKAKSQILNDTRKWFEKQFKGKKVSLNFLKRVVGSSRYHAHQGEQEMARRRSQIERGIIKDDQILHGR
jgi:hypothetical protein